MSQTASIANSPDSSANSAIMVSRSLLAQLRSALSVKAKSIDRLPSDREILDFVVSQMVKAFDSPVYYAGKRDMPTQGYKWFNSEICKGIQNSEEIVDKGRFVDACIIGYLWGGEGLKKWCVPSRLIRPRVLGAQEKIIIEKASAEIAAAKDTDSNFLPTTHTAELLE